jgi:hypothetical protein
MVLQNPIIINLAKETDHQKLFFIVYDSIELFIKHLLFFKQR